MILSLAKRVFVFLLISAFLLACLAAEILILRYCWMW